MDVKKNVQRTLVQIKVFKKIGSAFIRSSLDTVSDKICLASYRHFDPYTSSVYEEMITEQLKENELEMKVARKSFKLENQVINEMFV